MARRIGFWLGTAALLLAALSLRAQEGDADEESTARLAEMKRQPTVYEIATATDPPRSLNLHAEPVLRWDNPVSGVKDGIVAMWTSQGGRPEVVAQVFLSRDDVWMHEFQSLAESPLVMMRDGRRVWAPTEGGAAMQPVPDAPAPAKQPTARLVQMRALARQFSASVDFKTDFRDTQTTRYQLRLLPRPLHRYGSEAGALIDGALFAFVQGTNPEVFLLLEAHTTGDGSEWRYALAPMTGYGVRGEHVSGVAWESANKQALRGRTDVSYLVTRFEE